MRFAFVHAEKASYPIAAMCRLLGLSRQGYYAYVKGRSSPRIASELQLQQAVRRIHEAASGRYGSPRILDALRREGFNVGKRRVERSMRALGLFAVPRARHVITTRSDPSHAAAPNRLARDFTATRPNQRWVTDITYIWTAEGWAYLAAILDLYSRSVVGWALSASLATELPLAALENAVLRRDIRLGVVHHSDRGCQYTSADYRRALDDAGITESMSRRGNCWDNAVAESFFATLKTELVYRRQWTSRAELRDALFEYIEVFYNRKRTHSTLGYKTPAEVEQQYLTQAA